MVTKKPFVSSDLISFSIFRLQQQLTTILITEAPGPLNSIFANQLKCLTREKLRVFALKVAISGPYLTFL